MKIEDYDIVLQIEQPDGSFQCRGFTGVPAASKSWIALVSSGSGEGRKAVGELAVEIEAALLLSSPEAAVSNMSGAALPSNLKPADRTDRLNLLVLAGASDAPFQNLPWYANWERTADQSGVMVLLPPGVYESFFSKSLPKKHVLRRVNAKTWSQTIKETLASVLARANITSPTSRIFISYRRVETLPLALQLFDQLVKEGFDVFLDRFSIAPGYDFQRRLTQELEDKSMVVLLESRLLEDSEWTQHEIDFAKRHRLGMIALQMPDVTSGMASINAREILKASEFTKKPVKGEKGIVQWQKLRKPTLDRVVSRIKAAHADALFRRRHYLRKDLRQLLKSHSGVKVSDGSVGPLYVTKNADEHVLWLTTRPPELEDFRSVHGALHAKARSHDSKGIVVGPLAALEPDRQHRLTWLSDVCKCLAFDEGNLREFARKLATGALP